VIVGGGATWSRILRGGEKKRWMRGGWVTRVIACRGRGAKEITY